MKARKRIRKGLTPRQVLVLQDQLQYTQAEVIKLREGVTRATQKARDEAKLEQLKIVANIVENWGRATDSLSRAIGSILGQAAF